MNHFFHFIAALLLVGNVIAAPPKGGEPIGKEKNAPAATPSKGTGTPKAPTAAMTQQMMEMDAALTTLNERLAGQQTVFSPDPMASIAAEVSDDIAANRAKARKMFNYLDQNPSKVLETITPEALLNLPVGITKKLGDNSRITLGVLEAKFGKSETELTIFVKLNFMVKGSSEPNRELFFSAQGVTFTREGGISSFTAALLGDFILPMKQWSIVLKGANTPFCNGQTCAGTTATFNCGEFDAGNLCAEVVFPRNVLKPYNTTLRKAEETGRVSFGFSIPFNKASGLRDMYSQVCFNKPFCVAGNANIERFGFEVSNVIYDESDTQSPNQGIFPSQYEGDKGPTWTGIAIEKFVIHLPKSFKKYENESESGSLPESGFGTSAGGRGLIIDRTGFTGVAFYEHKPTDPTPQAYSASRWKMTLEKIEIAFLQNKFMGGSFGGGISVPLVDHTCGGSLLSYNATIDLAGQYSLRVGALTDVTIPIKALRSTGKFYAGSTLELLYENDTFYPSANLSGELNINTKVKDLTASNHCDNPSTESQTADFKGIRFQNLVFRTKVAEGQPKFQVGYFEYVNNSESTIANFPVSITRLARFEGTLNGQTPDPNDLWIDFAFKISLAKEQIAGASNLVIKTKYNEASGLLQFQGVNLRRIDVKASSSAFHLQGYVDIYENENQKGFEGKIKAIMLKPMVFGVEASAEFGYWKGNNTSNEGVHGNVVCNPANTAFRYGYIDFYAGTMFKVTGNSADGDPTLSAVASDAGTGTLPAANAIPTGIGDLAINGAGMGIYFNMRPFFNNGTGTPTTPKQAPANQVMVYEPCYQVPFGFKVMLGFQRGILPNPPMYGRINLDIALDRNYGINSVSMYGNAVFTSKFSQKMGDYARQGLGAVVDGADELSLTNLATTGENSQIELNKKADALNAKKKALNSNADFTKEGDVVVAAGIMLDIPNKVFHAEASAFVNQLDANGNGLVGVGTNGQVGKVVIHIDSEKFYLHAGNPAPLSNRIGLKYIYNSGSVKAYAALSAYLMIGSGVPTFPPPPTRVIDYLGLTPANYQKSSADYASIRDGFAYALGAAATLDVNIDVTQRYAIIGEADAGVDLLLSNVNNCSSGSWLGKGQVYAYAAARLYNKKRQRNAAAFDFGMWLRGNGLKPFGVAGDACMTPPIIGFITGKICVGFNVGTICDN